MLEWDSACLHAVSSAEAFIAGTLPGRLDATLQAVRAHAPSARVVVVGYPDLYDLSRSAGCIGLSTTKRTALNQGADELDRALSAAAARNGDVFADVRGQFSGHEICDSVELAVFGHVPDRRLLPPERGRPGTRLPARVHRRRRLSLASAGDSPHRRAYPEQGSRPYACLAASTRITAASDLPAERPVLRGPLQHGTVHRVRPPGRSPS